MKIINNIKQQVKSNLGNIFSGEKIRLKLLHYFTENPFRALVVILFSILYLPHALILIKDLNLISAYEVDPGSMIASIEALFTKPLYNMLNGYHSRYYGWTYFSINFFSLLPIKIALSLLKIKSKLIFYLSIKLIFFLIGAISSLLFLEINISISENKSKLIPFLITVLYIVSPLSSLFYFIHPETTGSLFLFAGILSLLSFSKSFSLKSYYIGLTSLVLASLSKQIFFFSSLPILFCFVYFYCVHANLKYSNALKNKDFKKLLSLSLVIPVGVLFVIHPYSFIQFHRFLLYQRELSASCASNINLTFIDSLFTWIKLLQKDSLMFLSFLAFPATFLLSIYFYIKKLRLEYFFFAINSISAVFVLLVVSYGNRLTYSHHYLFPCYLFLLLNIHVVIVYLLNSNKDFQNKVFKFLAIIFLVLATLYSSYTVIPALYKRLNYKKSSAYVSYMYVKENLTINDRVAHDHMVAIPTELNQISCHFWRGCGTDYIEEFNPNYVMLDPNYSSTSPAKETVRLLKYIKDHNMILIKKIYAIHGNTFDAEVKGSNSAVISIYKKL